MPARSLKLDLAALGLAAVTLLAVVSLLSYDPADPPAPSVWPPPESIANACGPGGAWLAHSLLQMLGVGAWYAAASLTVAASLLVARKPIDQPLVRAAGWALSALGMSTLAAKLLPEWSPGPLVGAGGYIGAMGRAWLDACFAAAGGYIFATSVLLAGLLMMTDYYLFAAFTAATSAGAVGAVRAGRAAGAAEPIRRLLRRWAAPAWGGARSGAADSRAPAPSDAGDEQPGDDCEGEYDDGVDGWDEEEACDDEADEGSGYDPDQSGDEHDGLDPEESDGDGGDDVEVDDAGGRRTAAAAVAAAAGGIRSKIAAALIKPKLPSPAAAAAAGPAAGEGGPPGRGERPRSERDEILDQLDKADQQHEPDGDYEPPPIDLLLPPQEVGYAAQEKEVRRKARVLEKTFGDFGFNVKVVDVETGPVIAQYEVELEAGLRLSKITGLADDLAIALRAPSVRIVAPIPGKNTVGIEAPNDTRQVVRIREVIQQTGGRARRMKIPVYLGKDVAGNPMIVDLAALPHLLIAGRTGTGKSVCLNSIIVSMLMTRGPDEVRMLMIDPKMVELSGYRKLPHLMHPVVTDMKKAEAILAWAVDKMEERYKLLAKAGVRHVSVYNQLGEEELRERIEASEGHPLDEAEWGLVPKQLPFIVIVADEMADLMMTAGKDVEQHIIRLAQKSRAVGIHLILATQKPTVDVITGLIKSNLPARIAFQVASRTDSRVVLDEMGADKLLGNGDMLFLSPGTSMLLRGQGTYVSDDEITRVVDFVGTDDPQFAAELMQLKTKDENQADEEAAAGFKRRDELYEAAVDVVVREGRGSVSLLQRCLGIGYGRAARLIDYMAEDKIVGPYNGSSAREVLISVSDWEAMSGDDGGQSTGSPADQPGAARHGHKAPRGGVLGDDSGEREDEYEPNAGEAHTAADAAGEYQQRVEELEHDDPDAEAEEDAAGEEEECEEEEWSEEEWDEEEWGEEGADQEECDDEAPKDHGDAAAGDASEHWDDSEEPAA